MNVSIGSRWEGFVNDVVGSGRYASASDVVTEGLRLVQEREAKLQALREILLPRLEDGASHSLADVREAVKERLGEWETNRDPQSR